jgi:hypothetical protein
MTDNFSKKKKKSMTDNNFHKTFHNNQVESFFINYHLDLSSLPSLILYPYHNKIDIDVNQEL